MLSRIDRIMMSVSDAATTAQRWVELLDARVVRHDRVEPLGAHRTVLQVGDAEVELLQPSAPGPVADHLASGRGGPFAAGVATNDLSALASRLAAAGAAPIELSDQLFVRADALGIPGLNLVISEHQARDAAGLLSNLYEVTHLTADPEATCRTLAETFALDASQFVPITSETFGYSGYLTLFDAAALHRIETIHPADAGKTMGRYFRRFGPSLYMCYGETDRLSELRERLKRAAPGDWTGGDDDPNGLFIHPRALGGVMVGASRTSYAWTWSGSPDRVQPA